MTPRPIFDEDYHRDMAERTYGKGVLDRLKAKFHSPGGMWFWAIGFTDEGRTFMEGPEPTEGEMHSKVQRIWGVADYEVYPLPTRNAQSARAMLKDKLASEGLHGKKINIDKVLQRVKHQP